LITAPETERIAPEDEGLPSALEGEEQPVESPQAGESQDLEPEPQQ
jgi:hypothetical protein